MNEDGQSQNVQTEDGPPESTPDAPSFSTPSTEAGVLPDAPVAGAPRVPPELALEVAASVATDEAAPATAEPYDALRARLLAQFEEWLDGMLAGESAPPVPEELILEALAETAGERPPSADLYTLFSAMTSLTGEVRLQGRAFKQLTDSLAPVAQLPGGFRALEESQYAVARRLDDLAEMQTPPEDEDSGLPASKEVLAVVFDLLERLERGLKSLETATDSIKRNEPRGLFAKLGGAREQVARMLDTMEATREGYRLTLSRLEAAVAQWGVQRIGKKGDLFDPAIMTVIEVESDSDLPDGSVTEVYKRGYSLHGKMLSTPQVKVAKRK